MHGSARSIVAARPRVAVAAVLLASSSGGTSHAPKAAARPAHHVKPPASHGATVAPVATGKPGTASVPVLMYHVIAPPLPNAPYRDLYVQPTDFRGQVAWLAEHGYHAVTLRRVYDFWTGKEALPRKPVVLTFDDGYRSDFTVALPTLEARHWPGVLNLEVRNLQIKRE